MELTIIFASVGFGLGYLLALYQVLNALEAGIPEHTEGMRFILCRRPLNRFSRMKL